MTAFLCIFTAADNVRPCNGFNENNLGNKLKGKRLLRGNLENALSSNNGLVQRKLVESSEAAFIRRKKMRRKPDSKFKNCCDV